MTFAFGVFLLLLSVFLTGLSSNVARPWFFPFLSANLFVYFLGMYFVIGT